MEKNVKALMSYEKETTLMLHGKKITKAKCYLEKNDKA